MSSQPTTAPAQGALSRQDLNVIWAVQWVLRMALGGLFLFAAWNKLHPPLGEGGIDGPQNFLASVQAFKLGMPDWMLRLSVSVTPWIEVVSGLALIFGIWRRSAAAVFGLLLIVFTALIISVLARDLATDCGCFGKLAPFCDKKITNCNIIQNSIMLAVAAYLTFAPVAPMRKPT